MNVKWLNVLIMVLISLHVTIKSTSAATTQKDVEACISEAKVNFEGQQSTAKKRFNELKTRKVNDMKEQIDERRENLMAFIQKEKNYLSTLKQSAIQGNFNVTMCNDSSTVYDLISNSFQASSDALVADYRGIVERNHTQNSILVDRLALKYRLLEQELDSCQQQSVKTECFDKVLDDCETSFYENEIFNLETSYYRAAETVFADFKMKVNSLYRNQLGEVQSFSKEMKICYGNIKNMNSTTDQLNNSGVSLTPLPFVVILPFMYEFFY